MTFLNVIKNQKKQLFIKPFANRWVWTVTHWPRQVIDMITSLAWAKWFHSMFKYFRQTGSLMCGTCLCALTVSSSGSFFSFRLYAWGSLCQNGLFFCKSHPSGNQPKKFNGGIMSVLDVSTISHLPEGTLLKDFTVIWFTRVPAGVKAKAKTNSPAERGGFRKDAIKLSCCF